MLSRITPRGLVQMGISNQQLNISAINDEAFRLANMDRLTLLDV